MVKMHLFVSIFNSRLTVTGIFLKGTIWNDNEVERTGFKTDYPMEPF